MSAYIYVSRHVTVVVLCSHGKRNTVSSDIVKRTYSEPTRKKLILEKLPNSLETEDMRKIR